MLTGEVCAAYTAHSDPSKALSITGHFFPGLQTKKVEHCNLPGNVSSRQPHPRFLFHRFHAILPQDNMAEGTWVVIFVQLAFIGGGPLPCNMTPTAKAQRYKHIFIYLKVYNWVLRSAKAQWMHKAEEWNLMWSLAEWIRVWDVHSCSAFPRDAKVCSAVYKHNCEQMPLARCVGFSQMCSLSGEEVWQTLRVEIWDTSQPQVIQLKGEGGMGPFCKETRHLPRTDKLDESAPRAAVWLGSLPAT